MSLTGNRMELMGGAGEDSASSCGAAFVTDWGSQVKREGEGGGSGGLQLKTQNGN